MELIGIVPVMQEKYIAHQCIKPVTQRSKLDECFLVSTVLLFQLFLFLLIPCLYLPLSVILRHQLIKPVGSPVQVFVFDLFSPLFENAVERPVSDERPGEKLFLET